MIIKLIGVWVLPLLAPREGVEAAAAAERRRMRALSRSLGKGVRVGWTSKLEGGREV
jgi:hypothetical protein